MKRGIDTNDRKLDEKLKAFIHEAEQVNRDENDEYRIGILKSSWNNTPSKIRSNGSSCNIHAESVVKLCKPKVLIYVRAASALGNLGRP